MKLSKINDIIIGNFNSINLKSLCKVPIIAIYKTPKDYPDNYVARLWDINKRVTKYIVLRNSLEDIRKVIPKQMTLVPRSELDDPVIVETWL